MQATTAPGLNKRQVSTDIILTLTTFDDNGEGTPASIEIDQPIFKSLIKIAPEFLSDEFANSSDIDEVVGDGKFEELAEYIGQIDYNVDDSDKLQFKEYLEPGKRLRHTSYNVDPDKSDDINDCPTIESNENEIETDAVPVGEVQQSHHDQLEEARLKRTKNSRKLNMFSYQTSNTSESDIQENVDRPVIRITSVEDERVERFLSENVTPEDDRVFPIKPKVEVLKKSETVQQFLCDDEQLNVDQFVRFETSSPTSDTNKRSESLASTDSNRFDLYRSDSGYNREDSLISNNSNVLYERSQSRYSDLEYIKGREDWKDYRVHSPYDINEQIDSDNYHHLRRFSETADTLEYIRGREDWQRNELTNLKHRKSLPRIFETVEHIAMIQDEIDSDEYHHNFFLHDAFRPKSEERPQKSVAGDSNFIEQYFLKGDTNELMTPTTYYSETSSPLDVASNLRDSVESGNTAWAAEGNEVEETIPPNGDGTANTVCFDEHKEINEVIEDLIKNKTSNSEDIEITVLNLPTEQTSTAGDKKNELSEPLILIREATDDERESTADFSRQISENNSLDVANDRPKPQSVNNDDADETIDTDTDDADGTTNDDMLASFEMIDKSMLFDDNTKEFSSDKMETNDFLKMEIQCEMSNRYAIEAAAETPDEAMPFIEDSHLSRNPRSISSASRSGDSSSNESDYDDDNTKNQLNDASGGKSFSDATKAQKPFEYENVEDLIRDVSSGPWFHK